MNAVNRFIPACTEDVFTCFMCTLTYDFFFLIGLTDGVGLHWFAVEWMAAVQLYVYALKHLHSRSHSFTSPSKADTWLETCLMLQKKKNLTSVIQLISPLDSLWAPSLIISHWKIHKFIFLQQRSSLFCFAVGLVSRIPRKCNVSWNMVHVKPEPWNSGKYI